MSMFGLPLVGDLIERGVEKLAEGLGMDPKEAEHLGDWARAGFSIATGDYFDVLSESSDLIENFDGAKASASKFLNNADSRVGDHRRDTVNVPVHAASKTGTVADYFVETYAQPPGPGTDLKSAEGKEAWKDFIGKASAGQIQRMVESGEFPQEVMQDEGLRSQIMQKTQSYNRMISFLSEMLNATHQTRKEIRISV